MEIQNSVKNLKRIKIGITWVRLTSQGSDDFPLKGKKLVLTCEGFDGRQA